MNLAHYTLIDIATGTVLIPHNCVLVHDDALTEDQWDSFYSASDAETCAIGREHGRPLGELIQPPLSNDATLP